MRTGAPAESRLSRFWCDVEPKLQARWALVASATEVLLEADRVEQALKKASASITDVIKEYAESAQPWCMLDTHHRHMESRWHNFESYGDDLDSIEKLVVKARQRYVEVGSEIARHFVGQLHKKIPGKGVARQREVFEKHEKPALGKEKVAYVWVDALRFEMARPSDPLAPGSVYTASVDDQGKVGLYRLEIGCSPGTGKMKIAGGIEGTMKESIQRAFAYLSGHKVRIGISQQVDTTDFHIEAIDLLSNHVA
jgi:hypothetical protein